MQHQHETILNSNITFKILKRNILKSDENEIYCWKTTRKSVLHTQ